ncbi:hypothetical protein [Flavobacterium sp. F52]|uniref:hypothetical protein n=1 Tax=Flavobacterium sp. F52 TaxID=1202532 RepID=UPI000272FE55|nr:hypothetical protein [Flavobacterium sp. F52]EJG00689.1 hypothetical protein FF52_13656 [Flavobacterium sp. F52]
MKQFALAVIFLLILNTCKAQERNSKINLKTMKTFDIKKFEENKGKQGFANEYRYILANKLNVRELDITSNATQNIKTYQREVTKEFDPNQSVYNYYKTGNIREEILLFNDSEIKILNYDESGKLVNEINFDTIFKHSFKEIRDIVLKEKNVDIYDTRQATALRHDTPDAVIKKYYQIHVIKSELIDGQWYAQPNYSFIIDDATGKEWDPKVEAENNAYFKTYKGKDYTKKEWEIFEEEWHKNYMENKNKGFWDDIFKKSGEK